MYIEAFKIVGYRSIRDITSKLDPVTVIVGKNGVGKSNLYKALQLIQFGADRQLARAIAAEGGIESVQWAGKKGPTLPSGFVLGIEWNELEYELMIGIETNSSSAFPSDPYVKTEKIWSRMDGRRTLLIDRAGPQFKYRDDSGHWRAYPNRLACNESLLSQMREPNRFPEVLSVRTAIVDWRFYQTFRADSDSPLRRPQIVFRTPMLDSDGGNLAATLLSILAGPNRDLLHELVGKAFPQAKLVVAGTGSMREIGIRMESISSTRVFSSAELSDGQLRFFSLMAALLSESTPGLIVLNEPEASLHPAAYEALAKAIDNAALKAQIIIVTHSIKLAKCIEQIRATQIRKLRWDIERGTRMDHQLKIERGSRTATEK